MQLIDVVGFVAASLVLATFSLRSMSALRYTAIVSNIAFIAYGYLGELMPILLLHGLLLPMNVLRLAQLAGRHGGGEAIGPRRITTR